VIQRMQSVIELHLKSNSHQNGPYGGPQVSPSSLHEIRDNAKRSMKSMKDSAEPEASEGIKALSEERNELKKKCASLDAQVFSFMTHICYSTPKVSLNLATVQRY
jgi:hypothetical protein